MKYYIFLGLLATFILGFGSCKEEIKPIRTGCGNNFILSEDKTACICPPETHYQIARTGIDLSEYHQEASRSCIQKGEFVYYVKIDPNNCLYGFSNEVLSWEPTGFWWYEKSGDGYFHHLYFKDENLGGDFFNASNSIVRLGDGEIEISFVTDILFPEKCHDWLDLTSTIVKGYGYGKSTMGNTKIDIEIVYKDKDDVVIDTGYIHLWKE